MSHEFRGILATHSAGLDDSCPPLREQCQEFFDWHRSGVDLFSIEVVSSNDNVAMEPQVGDVAGRNWIGDATVLTAAKVALGSVDPIGREFGVNRTGWSPTGDGIIQRAVEHAALGLDVSLDDAIVNEGPADSCLGEQSVWTCSAQQPASTGEGGREPLYEVAKGSYVMVVPRIPEGQFDQSDSNLVLEPGLRFCSGSEMVHVVIRQRREYRTEIRAVRTWITEKMTPWAPRKSLRSISIGAPPGTSTWKISSKSKNNGATPGASNRIENALGSYECTW